MLQVLPSAYGRCGLLELFYVRPALNRTIDAECGEQIGGGPNTGTAKCCPRLFSLLLSGVPPLIGWVITRLLTVGLWSSATASEQRLIRFLRFRLGRGRRSRRFAWSSQQAPR